MAKVSLEMSYTLDNINKVISFAKLTARIDELDLDEDEDKQLKNLDKTLEKASSHLASYLRAKADKAFKKAETNE